MQIEGKTFLVTGGAGLIGSHIVDQLIDFGAGKVVVLDNMLRGREANLTQALKSNRLELVVGDLRDWELLSRLVSECDGLFHMAALRIKHCREDPELAVETMFSIPNRMFLTAVNCGVERIVAASSSSIYGQAETFPTNETHHPYADTTLYGAAKLAAEGMLRALRTSDGLSYATMRFFNVYGPRMDIHGVYTEVMVRWMERIAEGAPPLIFGDGSDSMDFTYVGDAAGACIAAMRNDEHHGAYNVGTGVSTDLTELCARLLDAMDSDLKPEFCKVDIENDVRYRLADTAKIKADFLFETQINLAQGLRELVTWWRQETAATL